MTHINASKSIVYARCFSCCIGESCFPSQHFGVSSLPFSLVSLPHLANISSSLSPSRAFGGTPVSWCRSCDPSTAQNSHHSKYARAKEDCGRGAFWWDCRTDSSHVWNPTGRGSQLFIAPQHGVCGYCDTWLAIFREHLTPKHHFMCGLGHHRGRLPQLLARTQSSYGIALDFLACICWGLDNHYTATIEELSLAQSTCIKGLCAGFFNLLFFLQ